MPKGLRAVWDDRGKLAATKRMSDITETTCEQDHPGLLFSPGEQGWDADFVEVHIYGPWNVHSVEKVVHVTNTAAPAPTTGRAARAAKGKAAETAALQQKLGDLGIPYEEACL
ncbi:hypothetical protein LCGC14_0647530 [marine sediment metagenome]|uniref:Uncharacterized protein n=1 Tax=marine sediment metagenome TaxID=412755 RepID=A0A0F9TJ24_9ZZZZ